MNRKPYLINGGIHKDKRGSLIYLNDFDFKGIKRFYQVRNNSSDLIRAWQGHKSECKFFFVGQGAFKIALIRVDNWDRPSRDLQAQIFILKAEQPQVLVAPGGYANGVQAISDDALLTVFSDFTLEESVADTVRFDFDYWLF